MLGDANISLPSSLQDADVLAGWEIEQVTSRWKLVLKRRVQKGHVLTLFSQCGFDQWCLEGMVFPSGCRQKAEMSVLFLFSHWAFCGTLGKSLVSLSLGFLVA